MKKAYTYILFAVTVLFSIACNHSPAGKTTVKAKKRQPVNFANYVVTITTCKIKKGVKQAEFTRLDSVIERVYARKQPGYISKESGIDQRGNWLVVVSWDNSQHADAGFNHFMNNPLTQDFKKMIDTTTISNKVFTVKNDQSNSLKDAKPYVIELGTYQINKQVLRDSFEKRDKQIEADYISRQTGYITRRGGIAENGERLMMIYWKTVADADAAMKEFLQDKTVADYYKMIDWKSVDLKRFQAIN